MLYIIPRSLPLTEFSMENKSVKNILILGGGFAGLQAAKVLASSEHKVTVIDRCNHHLFQPLLYQVATAALSPADISMPIRSILRNIPNTEVIMAEVQRIEVNEKTVYLDRDEKLTYDYLIVATGARHGYFGHPEWEELAPGLKTLEDATEIRRRVLSSFEEAERATRDSVARRCYPDVARVRRMVRSRSAGADQRP